MPRVPGPCCALRPFLAFLAGALAGALAPSVAGAGEAPFAEQTLPVPGRPLEVFAAPVRGERTPRLVVVSIEGSAPDERRHLTVYACEAGGALRPAGSLAVPPEVVVFDVADALPGGGLEIALLSAGAPRAARSRDGGGARVARPRAPRAATAPHPGPPPSGAGRALEGGRHASRPWCPRSPVWPSSPSAKGPSTTCTSPSSPITWPATTTPGCIKGCSRRASRGPRSGRGDDDGDGRQDLLAFSRYDLSVFRSGAAGLPARPSRHVSLRPFTADEELRYLATSASLFARDLDGDGLVDLVLHRTFGTLLRSDATTSFWRNPGGGADPGAPPDARIEGGGGFGSVFLEDLDGDGRSEALQLFVPFGVVQLVRALLTETVQAELRAYVLEGPGIAAARPSYETTLTVAISSGEGRVAGVLPTAAGDWNGDGLRDLLHGESLRRIAIRLGVRGERGPGFGAPAASQEVPSADRALVADLDGDGLDDLALYDTLAEGGGVHVLRNRGLLPGTARRPELHAPEPEPEAAP